MRRRPDIAVARAYRDPERVRDLGGAKGFIVADNGSDMYISGTMDARWNNSVLNPAFSALTADDFDVVQLGWREGVAPSAPTNVRILR